MKVSKLLLATVASAAALASAGAYADTAEGSYLPEPLVAAKSRAAVQAELGAFKQARVNPWSTSYDQLKHARSERSRDEVRAEVLRSRQQIDAFTGEDSGSAYLARTNAQQDVTRFAGTPARAE